MRDVTRHTNPYAATSPYTRGTGLKSTGAGKLGRRLPYRTCSTRVRSCRTTRPPCGTTSRRWGSGCVAECVPVLLNVVVGRNGRSISLWTHAFGSLNSLFFGKAARIPPDHPHFLATQTCVLDRHAEEHVFVLLVFGGKGVLMEQHQFRVVRACFREFGKLRADGRDQAGLLPHALVIGHGAMRIADSESGGFQRSRTFTED